MAMRGRGKLHYPDTPYPFVAERKGPLTPSTVRKIIARQDWK